MKSKYRSIFISDFHLGSRACKAEQLVKFLKSHQCENLYLVGDIIDGWRLKQTFFWPQSHNNVIRQLLTKAKRGTKIYYIVGNHDEALRNWLLFFQKLGNLEILNSAEYTTVNGKTLLVTHGDMFDSLMHSKTGKLLMHLGDKLYDCLIIVNDWLSKIRSFLNLPFWSLSKYIKENTKKVVGYITQFEDLMLDYCKSKGYDGIIVGHVHTPNIKELAGVSYYNCGDFTENCSAIVETYDGEFKLILCPANK